MCIITFTNAQANGKQKGNVSLTMHRNHMNKLYYFNLNEQEENLNNKITQ